MAGIVRILVILATMTGCAAFGTGSRVTEPFMVDIADFDSVGIRVEPGQPGYELEARRLAAILLRKLRSKVHFESVCDMDLSRGARPELGLLVRIDDVTRVGEAMSFFLGPHARMAGLILRVRLMRMSNKSYIGEAIIDGQYTGDDVHPSTTDDAIDIAARQVIEYLESGIFRGD